MNLVQRLDDWLVLYLQFIVLEVPVTLRNKKA